MTWPGALISGFSRSSRVGPGLEKRASDPSVSASVRGVPVTSVQSVRVTYAPTVVTSNELPGMVTNLVRSGLSHSALSPPRSENQIQAS